MTYLRYPSQATYRRRRRSVGSELGLDNGKLCEQRSRSSHSHNGPTCLDRLGRPDVIRQRREVSAPEEAHSVLSKFVQERVEVPGGVRGERIPLPAPAAVLPEEQPEPCTGVSKLSDGASTPFRSKVLAPRRPEFEDGYVATVNAEFKPDLVLMLMRGVHRVRHLDTLLLRQPPAEGRDRGCRPPPVIPAGADALASGSVVLPPLRPPYGRSSGCRRIKVLSAGWLPDRGTPHGSP